MVSPPELIPPIPGDWNGWYDWWPWEKPEDLRARKKKGGQARERKVEGKRKGMGGPQTPPMTMSSKHLGTIVGGGSVMRKRG